MYSIYIIQNNSTGKYYIGQSNDVSKRLHQHNTGRVISTRHHRQWKLVLSETYPSRSEARKREIEIKKYKGGIKFKKLLGLWQK